MPVPVPVLYLLCPFYLVHGSDSFEAIIGYRVHILGGGGCWMGSIHCEKWVRRITGAFSGSVYYKAGN
jgi:hypothetical protein